MKRERVLIRKTAVLMLALCLAVVLMPIFVPNVQTPPTPTWRIETVDSDGDVGTWTSIAVDSVGNAHISYHNATGQDLKYAYWNGTDWSIEAVDGGLDDIGQYTSIALDSSGNPHISYSVGYYGSANSDLKYARWTGTEWRFRTRISAEPDGSWTSIAVDSVGNAHISYYNSYYRWLMYARYEEIGVHEDKVDPGSWVGEYTSTALDSFENPHISYYDELESALRYANWTGNDWQITTVDSTGDVGTYTSIAVDSSNYPHISYKSGGLAMNLKYARWNGTNWNTTTVDSVGNTGFYSSIALDSDDNPHISYYDATNDCVKYAWWDGTAWNGEILDYIGESYGFTSIALDSYDNPHISYYDATNEDLKYATKNEPPAPDANGPYYGTEGQPITFDGSASYDPDGIIVSYRWDFGDGNITTVTDPLITHTYAQDGIYTVYLTVKDDDRSMPYDTTTAYISDADPTADFSGTPRGGNPPLTVSFTDLSTSYDGIVSCLWNFGDGQTSTQQNPIHEYTDEGSYTVTLTAYEADGDSNTEIKEDYITVLLFNTKTLDSAGVVGLYTSVAVDSNDYPHISYQDDDTGDLKYTHWNGSAWDTETVDSAAWVGQDTSLALDSNNYPHISYTLATGWDLKYAKWTGEEWDIETVDSAGNVGSYTSISLDSAGNPHISYFDNSNDDLKYAKWTGATWVIETVPDPGSVGMWTSIALEPPNDYPHISYSDSSNGRLKYAKWTGISWVIETVDPAVYVGYGTSLALDSAGKPHISYHDFSLNDLKYARWTGTVWSIETVPDPAEDVGSWNSIALDSSDNPHISYRDFTNYDLKYARWTGTVWSITTVDSEGNVGEFTSIALDSLGNAHISYYDLDNNNLKYATRAHDVRVIDVTTSKTVIGQGYSMSIGVIVENQGVFIESFNVTVYYGDSAITAEQWETFWSLGDVNRDGYINVTDMNLVSAAFGTTPGSANWNLWADLDQDRQVTMFDITTCLFNQGLEIWTYAISGGVVGTLPVIDLAAGNTQELTFTWDASGIPYGDYVICAYSVPILGKEIDRADNTYADGTITVTIAGDIQGDTPGSPPDGDVDYYDFLAFAAAYLSTSGQPNHNSSADFDSDGDVDYDDFLIFASNYLRTIP